MPYGIIKVDQVTFTNAGVDQTISVSGIVASISGNITATGTISGNVIRGGTTVSGATVTGTAGQFGTITGNTAGFTTVTGTTVTGTTATFTSGVFTNISGGTHTITSGVFASGTAANPSITFQGDVNTGIYSPGADQVAISTNGTGRLFVDASGNVGVGASPVVTFAGQTHLTVNHSAGGTTVAGINLATDGTRRASLITYPSNSEALRITAESATLPITFYTNSNERMRIDSSGRLGVGTSSPSSLLHIGGGAAGITQATLQGGTVAGDYAIFAIQNGSTVRGRLVGDANVDALRIDTGGGASTKIQFYTGSSYTNAVTIDSSQRVGIGTSSPSYLLDASGSGSIGIRYKSTGAYGTIVSDNSSATGGGLFIAQQNGSTKASFGASGGIEGNTSSDAALFAETGGAIRFYTNGSATAKAILDSTGRLGIGTTSPSSPINTGRLMVQGGDIVVRDDNDGNSWNRGTLVFDIRNSNGDSKSAYIQSNKVSDVSSTLQFFTTATHALSERMRIDDAGRLLVGTSSGSYKFQINALGSSGFAFDDAQAAISNTFGSGGAITLRAQVVSSPGGGEIYLGGSTRGDSNVNAIVMSTASAERIRITSTGKTFLSSTDNSYGNFQVGNSASNGEAAIGFISGVTAFGTTPTSTNGDNNIYVIGNNVFNIGGNSWGIGNKGRGNYIVKLTDQSATSWTFSSDERLKDIQDNVKNALEKINALRPVYYNWKSDKTKKRKVGLIAQDVLKVLPEAVDVPPGYAESIETGTSEEPFYLGIGYTDLVPLLVAALKESKERIEALEATVQALKE